MTLSTKQDYHYIMKYFNNLCNQKYLLPLLWKDYNTCYAFNFQIRRALDRNQGRLLRRIVVWENGMVYSRLGEHDDLWTQFCILITPPVWAGNYMLCIMGIKPSLSLLNKV